MPEPRHVGTQAEDLAADYLLSQGYTIVARRAKLAKGELDVVALDGDIVVFAEVKVRNTDYESAEASLNEAKVARLKAAAEEYLAAHNLQERVVRFDLVAIKNGVVRHERDFF
jgi:putative endonuclease